MTAALLESTAELFSDAGCEQRPQCGCVTLEERLESAWCGVRAAGVAECPVCYGRLVRRAGEGECEGCGARLR